MTHFWRDVSEAFGITEVVEDPNMHDEKWLQHQLKTVGLYPGEIDGDIGPLSIMGMIRFLETANPGIEHKLDLVLARLGHLEELETQIMTDLTDQLDHLETAVKANADVEDSAILLLDGLTKLINDLKSATTDPAVIARIQAVSDAVEAKKAALAAAVAADTPA